MFGLSKNEKRKKNFRETLGNFLKLYPGGLQGAYSVLPSLEKEDLRAQPTWSVAKYALLATKQVIIRTLETSLLPDEKARIAEELDKLDWKAARLWALGQFGKTNTPLGENLHPATVYIALAECLADMLWLGKQYDKELRDEFTREIIQTLIGMSSEERAHSRLRAALDEFTASNS